MVIFFLIIMSILITKMVKNRSPENIEAQIKKEIQKEKEKE